MGFREAFALALALDAPVRESVVLGAHGAGLVFAHPAVDPLLDDDFGPVENPLDGVGIGRVGPEASHLEDVVERVQQLVDIDIDIEIAFGSPPTGKLSTT